MQTDNTTTEEQGTYMQTDNNTTTQGATESSGVADQGENYHQMTVDDIVGRQFESVDEAEKFYQGYSTAIGFALAQVLSMRNASIPTSWAYDYIVNQCGGFEFVGFTAKDLFNKLDVERRVNMMNGDAQAAITFMNARAIEDPDFYCKFQVDEEEKKPACILTDGDDAMRKAIDEDIRADFGDCIYSSRSVDEWEVA
ncbi:hypothetical protein M0R45_019318 [Rubus argutus]|uniref:Uncharacterized protein n=1 Tax=Rubus argutus TaxID=59490 RepID=A0AAW1X7S8_RUBAR